MPNRELIGLDLGQNKTGVARASTAARLAEAKVSVPTSGLADHLNQQMADYDIEAVVVGLPRNLEGSDTAQTKWVRQFVEKLKTEVKLPFYWQDEALTTVLAERQPNTGQDDHAMAAKVILQDWIDTPAADRVRC